MLERISQNKIQTSWLMLLSHPLIVICSLQNLLIDEIITSTTSRRFLDCQMLNLTDISYFTLYTLQCCHQAEDIFKNVWKTITAHGFHYVHKG